MQSIYKLILALLSVLVLATYHLTQSYTLQWDALVSRSTPIQRYIDGQNASLAVISPKRDVEEYVALCLAIKNDGPALQEWLMHHYYHLGIKRFYILDDHSEPPIHLFKQDWGIPSDAISFRRIAADRPGLQVPMYDACQKWFGHLHQWIGYLDIDEFIELKDKSGNVTMADFLVQYEGYGALAINWQAHNSNGHLYSPEQGVRKGYTKCIEDVPNDGDKGWRINVHVKCFVNTNFYDRCTGPHSFQTTNNSVTVGEYHDLVTSPFRDPITQDKIVLHHYVVKSITEYGAKMQRGSAMKNHKTWEFWDFIEGLPSETCTSMAQYDP